MPISDVPITASTRSARLHFFQSATRSRIDLGLGLSREVLSFARLAGVTIGFAGLVLFMNPAVIDWRDPRAVAGNLLLLLSAICWAAGSCLYQRHPWKSNFWAQTFWQLAVEAVTIIALAVVLEPD
jgi:drug/metabolite transporter (DMT)-like permease